MKAKDLRIEYFEMYITFEHEVRALGRRLSKEYKTKNKSLSKIINDIGIFNYNQSFGIRVKYLKSQNKVRNWLAHSPQSLTIPKKYIEYMKDIKNLLNEIKNIKSV